MLLLLIDETEFIKDRELKLTASYKRFHNIPDSFIIDQVVTFETIKNQ